MRKIISFMHASLDGFVSGPNEEMSWITMDEEIFQDAIDLATTADVALYGRVTYEMMKDYWPTVLSNPSSTELELCHASWVEKVDKIVFSKTLSQAGWRNARLINSDIPSEMARLKNQPGENMMIFGSPSLTNSFMRWGLIDEYRINVNPVILGKGVALFENVTEAIGFRLLGSKNFHSGVVALHYERKLPEAPKASAPVFPALIGRPTHMKAVILNLNFPKNRKIMSHDRGL